MSTYWYAECLDHDPPLRSADEVEQHTHGLPAIRALIESRPIDPEWYEKSPDYFEANACRFLRGHPKCRIQEPA